MPSCAFRDCGRPDCHLCTLATMPTRKVEGRMADGVRETARAVPEGRPRVVKVSKKRRRVGPHR